MTLAEIIFTQLATRIPKDLHRKLKTYCVAADTSLMQVVTTALVEFLARVEKKK